MARRAIIASGALKGYLLEEIIAYLISKAGYRLLTDPQDDPHDLDRMGHGLQVRGRGGFHQADVLGELSWAPAFGNPIRLFIEAKWRGESGSRIGIPEVRHAVGILQDINQVLVTVKARRNSAGSELSGDDITASGRSFCYSYRYALCSTSGFTDGAQAYALAHQVALLDLSHDDYRRIREAVDEVGNDLHAWIEGIEEGLRTEDAIGRGGIVRTIRATLRQELWGSDFDYYNANLVPMLEPIMEATREIGELFIGVSATGFVILLKADNPELMIEHMLARRDPQARIRYQIPRNGSSQWKITLSNPELENCELSFTLPALILRVLDEKRDIGPRAAALNLKEQHFSRITLFRITNTKSMVCCLKLDRSWLAEARRALDEQPRGRQQRP